MPTIQRFPIELLSRLREAQDVLRLSGREREDRLPPLFRVCGISLSDCWEMAQRQTYLLEQDTAMLVIFHAEMHTQDVLRYLWSNGLRAGDIRYALTLAVQHAYLFTAPLLEVGKPLVVTGTILAGGIVPVFCAGAEGVSLSEGCADTGYWPPETRFLATPS